MMIIMLVGLCLLCFLCGYFLGALSGAVAVADYKRDPLPARQPGTAAEVSVIAAGITMAKPCPGCGHEVGAGAAVARLNPGDDWWHRGCYSHAWMRGDI